MESWHVHELMLGIIAALIAGFIFAYRRMSALSTKVAELEIDKHDAQQLTTGSNDREDFVIKCVTCNRYQVHGDHWFTPDEFATHIREADPLGGVCPNCRISSDNKLRVVKNP